MRRTIPILKSLSGKIVFSIGLLASVIAIITVDFSPPLPNTSVSYMRLIDEGALDNGKFSKFVSEMRPTYAAKAAAGTLTPEDINNLDVPETLLGSFIGVSNLGAVEIENLKVSFTFYANQEPLYSEEFAGELTLGPERENSIRFRDSLTLNANFLELCLVFDGQIPFEKVTERYLVAIEPDLLQAYSNKSEYDRQRWFFYGPKCSIPPASKTIENNGKY